MRVYNVHDFEGSKIGNIYVKFRVCRPNDNQNDTRSYWLCVCSCGNEIILSGHSLLYRSKGKYSHKSDCGHSKSEMMSRTNTKHGLTGHGILNSYKGMLDRCNNPNNKNYHNYGGRGIKVCDEWLGESGLINFYNWSIANGWAPKLQIDKDMSNSNYYSPDTCRWVSGKDNSQYRRTNHSIFYNDIEFPSITLFAEYIGQRTLTVRRRIQAGWSIDRIANVTPKDGSKHKRKKPDE